MTSVRGDHRPEPPGGRLPVQLRVRQERHRRLARPPVRRRAAHPVVAGRQAAAQIAAAYAALAAHPGPNLNPLSMWSGR